MLNIYYYIIKSQLRCSINLIYYNLSCFKNIDLIIPVKEMEMNGYLIAIMLNVFVDEM